MQFNCKAPHPQLAIHSRCPLAGSLCVQDAPPAIKPQVLSSDFTLCMSLFFLVKVCSPSVLKLHTRNFISLVKNTMCFRDQKGRSTPKAALKQGMATAPHRPAAEWTFHPQLLGILGSACSLSSSHTWASALPGRPSTA